MKIIDWMRQLGLAAEHETDLNTHEAQDVIDQHVIWKRRFESGIRTGVPDSIIDEHGPLQHWLAGARSGPFGKDPLLDELIAEYAQFRDSVTEIHRLALDGQQAQAVQALAQGNYARRSLRIKRLLIDLRMHQIRPQPALAASRA